MCSTLSEYALIMLSVLFYKNQAVIGIEYD